LGNGPEGSADIEEVGGQGSTTGDIIREAGHY
jgi:hypothetical protein